MGQPGDNGDREAFERVQQYLVKLGVPGVRAGDRADPVTANTIAKLQRAVGLEATGAATADTVELVRVVVEHVPEAYKALRIDSRIQAAVVALQAGDLTTSLDDLITAMKTILEVAEALPLLPDSVKGAIKALKTLLQGIEDIKHKLKGLKDLLEGKTKDPKEIIRKLRELVGLLGAIGLISADLMAALALALDGIESIVDGVKDLQEGRTFEGIDKILDDLKKLVGAAGMLGLLPPEVVNGIKKIIDGLREIVHDIQRLRRGETAAGLISILSGLIKILEGLKDLGIIK